jgi:iron complex outermembrane recepter protein
MTKFNTCAMTSLFVLASALATPAFAQAANASDENDAVGEIIVTAQKRSERLQDVPAAVSVVSGDQLVKLSANNIEDSARLVPALTFVKGTTGLNSGLFLRGLGTTNFSIAAEPSVSTVLDGVVLARAGEAFGDLYDIERVEVLRGPQGTLFGKNASAGVVNIVTREPGDTFGGYAELGYFDRSEFKAKASLGGPISDGIKVGITGFYGNYDGNLYNRTAKTHVNGYKHYGGRLQIVGDVGSNLKIRFLADYRKSDDDCCAFVIGSLNPTAAAVPAVASVLAPIQGAATRDIVQSRITRTTEKTWGTSLQADLGLGEHTLTSITSYRKWNNTEIRDGSWVDQVYRTVPLIYDDGPQKSSTFTQELRLTSPTGGMLDYVVGAYYYKAKARRIFTRFDTYCTASPAAALPSGLTPCPAGSTIVNPAATADFGSVFENYALFGQATLHLGERLRFVGGLRYTHDNLSVDHIRRNNYVGTAFPGVGGPAGISPAFDFGVYNFALANAGAYGGSNGKPWTTQTSNNNVSGKAALEYAVSPSHMAYVSYGRGYKGPAYNVFFNFQFFNDKPIEAELSDSYEVGLKNSMWGGRVILNLAAFYAKVKNYQSNFPTTVNNVVTTTIINAGDVSSRGFEADWLFRPTGNFTVNGGVSYTNARVDFFRPPPAAQAGNAIAPGTPLAFAPKLKGSLGVNYTIEAASLPFGVELGAQATFTDKQLSGLQATNTNAQILTQGALTIPAYEQVDFSLAAVGADNRYRHYASTIATGGPGGTILYQIPRDADRYIGVTARVNFGGK